MNVLKWYHVTRVACWIVLLEIYIIIIWNTVWGLTPKKCLFTCSEKDLSSTQHFLEKYCETSQMRPLKVHEKLAVIGSFSWLVTWYINVMLAQDKQTNSSHHFRCSLPSGFFSSQHCVFLTTWLTNRKGPKKKWPYYLGLHIRSWLSDFVIDQKNLVIIKRRSCERVDLRRVSTLLYRR